MLIAMAPLRVAIVADALLGQTGGVSRSVSSVTRELARLAPERLRLTVVARRRPRDLDGLDFRRSFSPRVPRIPNAIFALQRPLTLRGFDLIHYMDSRPPLDFPLGRTPTVVTQHGFAALLFGGQVPRRVLYVNQALMRLARYADLTLTPSESERRLILDRAPIDPERIVAVHHGVDHDRFHPPADREAVGAEVRARFGIDGRYVLYVANHQFKKNPRRLVEAFAEAVRGLDDVSLVIGGSGTPRFQPVLERIDQLGLRGRVRLLGHVDDEALRALYGAADVFALPSLHESFGMPVLEAMACGAPVLTSNVYSLPEICGDAAEYVDPYEVRSIAAGLRRLLEEPERAQELRALGVERAAGFTWRRAAEQHAEAYERAVSL
jgi:glycosyltransferase involved in cell wall biosynthesis